MGFIPVGITKGTNKEIYISYRELEGLTFVVDKKEVKVPNNKQSKKTTIIQGPKNVSIGAFSAEVSKDNSRLVENIGSNKGMVVIHAQIKLSFQTSGTFKAGEAIEVGHVLDSSLRPPFRMPLAVATATDGNRRYTVDINSDGVVTLRTNIDYTPTAGSVLYLYVSGTYVL